MSRREHGSILGDVLDGVDVQAHDGTPRPSLTGLAARANLPHDRLVNYLQELRDLGMAEGPAVPHLTPKGKQFLECYRAWNRIQGLYGLHAKAQVATVELLG